MSCFWPVLVRHGRAAPGSSVIERFARRVTVIVLLLLGTAQPATALDTDPLAVDESPALSIGNFEVSRYLLDKNYNQFVAAHRAKFAKPPGKDDISSWFRLFVAQQAIHARLVEAGYLVRPEVQREVARMARQILTQADGPLYQSLYPPEELPEERLRALHEMSARVFDALMVRFDDAATASALMGTPASPRDFEQAVSGLARSNPSKFDIHDGPSIWPHGSFHEMADVLVGAPHGVVVGPLPRALGVYFLLVRSESRQPMPDFETTRAGWENYVRRSEQTIVQQARRHQILRECEFRPEVRAIAEFGSRMAGAKSPGGRIDENAAAGGPEKVLATYTTAGGRRLITSRGFVRQFNQRLIRTMPRDTPGLVSSLQDIVVEEYDYEAAVAARLDRDPKFVQDRRNFELRQALGLYENEILAPRIRVSPAQLQSYYAERTERYSVPGEARGTLYLFASNTAAVEALSRLNRGETTVAHAEEVIERTVVSRHGPPLVTGRPNDAILAMPDGRAFGPFDHLGRRAIFLKRSSGERQAPPFGEIESVVREHFLREKLDELEVALFQEQGSHGALRMYFEFSKYGIEDPFGENRGNPPPRPARLFPSSPPVGIRRPG